MVLDFPLVGLLGVFDASFHIGSCSAVQGIVISPEGGIALFQ